MPTNRICHGRRSHRGASPGPPDRPGGRRRPRKRRRSGPGRGENHAGSDQLHGQVRPRPDLPGAHRRPLRRAAPAADVADEYLGARHAVHRIDRRAARHHHRHQRRRPRHHHSCGHRSGHAPGRPGAARPRLSAARAARRRAGARRTDRSFRGSGAHRRTRSRRRDLRNHERRRHHGAPAAADRILRASTA